MRKEKPTGKEISEKSKEIKLDKEKTTEEKFEGKKIKFTPSILEPESMEDLEQGQVIGILDHEIERKGKLPPGKYNIFIAKVNGEWQGYAESNGNIDIEASSVTVKRHHWGDCKHKKPSFKFSRICVTVCIKPVLFFCLVSVTVCS